MVRPSSNWKNVERAIARYWPGAKRRGADFRNQDGTGGKNDVVGAPGWSIEIKTSKRPTYSLITEAVRQSESSKDLPDDIPIAVIHKAGTQYKDSLVVFRLETFAQLFINNNSE